MKSVLITGVNGFVGHHLAKELHNAGYRVHGIGGHIGSSAQPPFVDIYTTLDLADSGTVETVDFSGVDAVIHLAGLAAVAPSFDEPMRYININIGIQVNLFEAAIAQGASPKFLIISSGSLYDPKTTFPITEMSPVDPSSPYAVSKLGQEQMAQYYAQRGFECIIARPFNHIGPGQGPGFIVPDLAQQIVSGETVKVGNLDSERDYTDVRDIARAYRLLLEAGQAGQIYNVCSGAPVSGHKILEGLQKAAESSAPIEQDPSRMRPADNPVIYGSHDKLTADTGWQPEISLDTTLADVIADWRSQST
ncbi:MAG: NAD-dependent epimerase/dehydratase [Candidatus Saccharibacteria bacterium]|nr:NAD-dependent epimerase/dehydratase [Candidatus Saccharibacteria bacterium]